VLPPPSRWALFSPGDPKLADVVALAADFAHDA
jgi:hypothetical protein